MKYLSYIALFLFSLTLTQCKEEAPPPKKEVKKTRKKKALPPVVQAPFPVLKDSFQIVLVDADSGKQFFARNGYGSSIDIPKNAFVDSAGEPLSGKIEIRYREFHSAASIFCSGIPLNYNSAGLLRRFQSAGMFEIRAYQEGKEVQLDSGLVIRVNMASFSGQGNYHAFYLDEKNQRQWNYMHDLNAVDNPRKRNLAVKARSKVKELNIPLGPDYFAFNYKSLLDIYLNDQVKEIAKHRADLTIQNKIKEYGVTWSEIYCYKSIDYMGNRYLASMMIWKKITPDPWPAWAKVAVTDIVHVKGNQYELSLNAPKGQIPAKKYIIEALMPIKSLLATPAAQWRYNYNEALQKAMREEMRMNLVADVFREFEVHNMGIYNVDRLMKRDLYAQVKMVPKFDDDIEVKNDFRIYYISPANRCYLSYPYEEWTNVTLTDDPGARLFAVLPGQRIAMVETKELQGLAFRKLRENQGQKVELHFKTLPDVIQNRADIARALGLSEIPS